MQLGGGAFALLLLLGLFALSAAVILALRHYPTLRVVKLENEEMWLAGAGPEFLALLPVYPAAPGASPAPVQSLGDWRWFVAVVVRHQGRAVIHWPGVLFGFMIAAATLGLFGLAAGLVLGHPKSPAIWLSVPLWAALITGLRIRRGKTMPVANLLADDEPAAPEAAGRRIVLPVVAAVLVLLAASAALFLRGARGPDTLIRGTVTDAATGRPIAGARVADNLYHATPDRPPQATWTDTAGNFVLRTWYEEHTVAASAPGYETRLATLSTRTFSREREVRMNFRLAPADAKPSPPVSPARQRNLGTPRDERERLQGVVDEVKRRRAEREGKTPPTPAPNR